MEDARRTTGLAEAVRSGQLPESQGDASNGVVLGSELSIALKVGVGDTVALLSQSGLEESLTMLAQPKIVRRVVQAIFQSQNKDYDAYWAYTTIETGRELFDIPAGSAMGIEVRISDFEESAIVAAGLRQRLGTGYRVETWQDMHSDLFGVMELERWAAFVILSLIVVVAVFNVLGSLTMSVIEKVRDIGIMKTMGSTDNAIQRLYLSRGLMIGSIGTLIGLAIGLTICWLQIRYGFYQLRSGYFIIPALPVVIRTLDVVLVGATAIALATVAALYPARRAARVLPADAVRWE